MTRNDRVEMTGYILITWIDSMINNVARKNSVIYIKMLDYIDSIFIKASDVIGIPDGNSLLRSDQNHFLLLGQHSLRLCPMGIRERKDSKTDIQYDTGNIHGNSATGTRRSESLLPVIFDSVYYDPASSQG